MLHAAIRGLNSLADLEVLQIFSEKYFGNMVENRNPKLLVVLHFEEEILRQKVLWKEKYESVISSWITPKAEKSKLLVYKIELEHNVLKEDKSITETTPAANVKTDGQTSANNEPFLITNNGNKPIVTDTKQNEPVINETKEDKPGINTVKHVMSDINAPFVIETEQNAPVMTKTDKNEPTVTTTEDDTPVVIPTEDNKLVVISTEDNKPVITPPKEIKPITTTAEKNKPTLTTDEDNKPVTTTTDGNVSPAEDEQHGHNKGNGTHKHIKNEERQLEK